MATETSRRMRADARRNYERLLSAARDAFAAHGPEASLDDIARRAGVGAGTLYRHFPTRENLIEAVYREDITRMSDRAYRLLDELPPAEALAEWLREQLGWIQHQRGLAFSLKAAIDKDSETFAFCRNVMRTAAGTLLARAREAGTVRPDIESADLLYLVHGVAVATEYSPENADRLLSVMLDGLRG